MLYWLLYQKLFPYFHPFRIFRYVTFRTAFASLTALLIALLIGPFVIEKLRQFQISQYIREDGPESHKKKSGTPTMGGVLIVIAILLPTVLWSDPANPLVWVVVFSTLAFGAIGFADDYIKVVKRRNLGLTARAKLAWQGAAGAAVAIILVVLQQFRMFSTQLTVPFFKQFRPVAMKRGGNLISSFQFFMLKAVNNARFDCLDGFRCGFAGEEASYRYKNIALAHEVGGFLGVFFHGPNPPDDAFFDKADLIGDFAFV